MLHVPQASSTLAAVQDRIRALSAVVEAIDSAPLALHQAVEALHGAITQRVMDAPTDRASLACWPVLDTVPYVGAGLDLFTGHLLRRLRLAARDSSQAVRRSGSRLPEPARRCRRTSRIGARQRPPARRSCWSSGGWSRARRCISSSHLRCSHDVVQTMLPGAFEP